MTKAKAKRFALWLEELADVRSAWMAHRILQVEYSTAALRHERDQFTLLAAELRLLSEGKRLPKKKAVR